ncbi:hypothetical protein GPECTOR_118g379 [Gonium pectorale]|uniref:EGF-like domain-containing protein n=1 Tax=Gonium pectorale TaxID=33097 RepID=A0A150FYU9_GONPE|nr:hypothetical protein GPECTOR_118g379 [Gonium pectorale]|eukprot:KXZ42782.1 hypothetical protein GPECTOR_118g379 [Gonium pectorale]
MSLGPLPAGPCERFTDLCGASSVATCSSTGTSTYECICKAGAYYDQLAKKCKDSTCFTRNNFLAGSSGVNGASVGFTVCPLRPTEDRYLCARSWDTQATLVKAVNVSSKADCRELCTELGWSCSHFTFTITRLPGTGANCFLKADMFVGSYGATRMDFGTETCSKVAAKPGTLADGKASWADWNCTCAAGYVFDSTLKKCLAANCLSGGQPCGAGGSCACRAKFFFDPAAKTCLDNPCVSGPTKPCGAPAAALRCNPVAIDSGSSGFIPSYTCTCKPGFFFDSTSTKTCQRNPCTAAATSPCGITGTFSACTPVNTTDVTCKCAPGYTFDAAAKTCLRDLCAAQPNPCGGPAMFASCTSINGTSYTCGCKAGYFFDTQRKTCIRSVCNSRGANPCVAANSICNAMSPTSYNCTCDSSFLYDKFTKTCYSDPCFDPSVCGGPTKAVTCNPFNATAYTFGAD